MRFYKCLPVYDDNETEHQGFHLLFDLRETKQLSALLHYAKMENENAKYEFTVENLYYRLYYVCIS